MFAQLDAAAAAGASEDPDRGSGSADTSPWEMLGSRHSANVMHELCFDAASPLGTAGPSGVLHCLTPRSTHLLVQSWTIQSGHHELFNTPELSEQGNHSEQALKYIFSYPSLTFDTK